MRKVGIFGTSGMAREAGDIAWALGLEPIYVARVNAERRHGVIPGMSSLKQRSSSFLTFCLLLVSERMRFAEKSRSVFPGGYDLPT